MERKHFDVPLWVCVSNDFNKVKILGAMLQMIDKTTGGLSNRNACKDINGPNDAKCQKISN